MDDKLLHPPDETEDEKPVHDALDEEAMPPLADVAITEQAVTIQSDEHGPEDIVDDFVKQLHPAGAMYCDGCSQTFQTGQQDQHTSASSARIAISIVATRANHGPNGQDVVDPITDILGVPFRAGRDYGMGL